MQTQLLLRAALAALALAVFAAPSFADDDDDDDDGKKRRFRDGRPYVSQRDDGKNYRYEFQDRLCHYKHEYNYKNGKEKIKQEGDCRHVVAQRPQQMAVVLQQPVPRQVSAPPPATTTSSCNRQELGVILGGVIGGVVGRNVAGESDKNTGTVIGAVIGAVVGGSIGRTMDKADQACVMQALEHAQPGHTVQWAGPGGVQYTVAPQAEFTNAYGQRCRSFKTEAKLSSRQFTPQASSACRAAEGRWVIG